jgi:hypothetical protein
MGTNADHQRAWRQRQKAKVAALEARPLRKGRKRRDDDPVNSLISEAFEFVLDYGPRVAAQRNTLAEDGRHALIRSLHQVANDILQVAQGLRN